MSKEILWQSERFDVVRETIGQNAGRIKVVNLETGRVDWPINYGDAGSPDVAFDDPHRLPSYVREVATILCQPDDDLRALRLQLATMIAFMHETQGPKGHQDGLWWSGDMPAFPSEYNPASWQEDSWPIWKLWSEFRDELKEIGLMTRYNETQKLPVADLLAASKRGADG